VQKGWRLMERREWKCGGWDIVELVTEQEGKKGKAHKKSERVFRESALHNFSLVYLA
jgi:hypothetical protein